MTIVAQILNFLILVLILKFVAYKPVMKMLKEREEKIARSIDAAEADEQKAKELLAEYNKQLADARIKAQEIVDKAMKRAQEERDASVAETRREIEQMRKAAKDKFPTLECCILSGGIFMCYFLFMILPHI